MINQDEEDTIDDVHDNKNDIHANNFDDLYDIIDLNHDLPHMLSIELSITPSIEYSQHGPCLELAIVPSDVPHTDFSRIGFSGR